MNFPSFEKGKDVGGTGLGKKFWSSVLYVLVFRYLLPVAFSSECRVVIGYTSQMFRRGIWTGYKILDRGDCKYI